VRGTTLMMDVLERLEVDVATWVDASLVLLGHHC
jgi:hypothetical protein